MVVKTTKSVTVELDDNMDRKINRTYSSSSKKSTTSRRSTTSKKSTSSKKSTASKSSNKSSKSSSLKKSASPSEGRDQTVVSRKVENVEEREESGTKIDLKFLDVPDDEQDRILFNSTMSTDGDESDVRYRMVDDDSVGYDDVGGCIKLPYFCKDQGTFSIDDDSCLERYNTYDETYQQVIINKQERRKKEMDAATSKIVKFDDINLMKSEIELPRKPKKVNNDAVVAAPKISEDASSVSTLQKAADSPLPINRTPSLQTVTSLRSLKQESVAHMSIAEEKPEEVAEETQVETIDDTAVKTDEVEDVKDIAGKATKTSTNKKKSTKKTKSKTSFFSKQKKSSTKKEDTKNKKEKKGMFSFLKKSKTKTKTSTTNKSNENKEKTESNVTKKEDVNEELIMPLQIKDNTTTKNSSSMAAILKEIDDDHEGAYASSILGKEANPILSNLTEDRTLINEELKSTEEGKKNDDDNDDENKETSSAVKAKESNESSPNGDDLDYMSLDSIGESLGAFISVTGDKLYESYMGFGKM